MKKKFAVGSRQLAVLVLLVGALSLGFALSPQGNIGITEQVSHPPNTLRVVARHCQNYFRDGVVDQEACAADPSTIFNDQTVPNLRTNAGGDWQSSVMGNTAAPPATANYMALTNTAITPAVTDTTLSGEIVANNLGRAQATYTNTSHTQFTLTKTFTCTTAPQAAQGEAIFNAASTGTMVFEDTFTAVSLQINDTVAMMHTINY